MRNPFQINYRTLEAEAKFSYQFAQLHTLTTALALISAHMIAAAIENLFDGIRFETLFLRLIASCLILAFWARTYGPTWLNRYAHSIWIVYVAFQFPYCFGTILLVDAAVAPTAASVNLFAVTEYVLSCFFLVQIAFSIRLILLMWGSATLLTHAQLFFLTDPNWPLVLETTLFVFPFFLTVLLLGGLINRGLFNFQRDKEDAVWNVANSIAHQLRTPLASIRNFAAAAHNIATNSHSKELGATSAMAQPRVLVALDAIQNQVTHALALIDILIANAQPPDEQPTSGELFAINELIREAIETFPYNNDFEKNLATFEPDSDFLVLGNRNVVLHVIYNLLGNAVEFCQKSPVNAIKIRTDSNENWNQVIVWDSGIGVPRENLHRIFEPFFTVGRQNGTGIGLSFCDASMHGLGGKIECHSEEGKYCEFTLFFPKQSTTIQQSQG